MSRLGRVPPSAGRDVIDRKACFLSLLAQAAVWPPELRVSRTFLDQLRPQLFRPWIPSSSVTAGFSVPDRRRVNWRPPVSRTAGSGDPRRTSLTRLRIRLESLTYNAFLSFRSNAQFGARHRWRTPTIHRGRAQRTSSAGSWFGQGSPDPRRTKQIRSDRSRDQRAVKTNFAACHPPSPSLRCLVRN